MTSYVIVPFDLARFAAVPAFVAQKVRHRSVKVLVRIRTKNGVVAVRVQLQERDGITGFVCTTWRWTGDIVDVTCDRRSE